MLRDHWIIAIQMDSVQNDVCTKLIQLINLAFLLLFKIKEIYSLWWYHSFSDYNSDSNRDDYDDNEKNAKDDDDDDDECKLQPRQVPDCDDWGWVHSGRGGARHLPGQHDHDHRHDNDDHHHDNHDNDDVDHCLVSGDALGWAAEPRDGQVDACRRRSCHSSQVLDIPFKSSSGQSCQMWNLLHGPKSYNHFPTLLPEWIQNTEMVQYWSNIGPALKPKTPPTASQWWLGGRRASGSRSARRTQTK